MPHSKLTTNLAACALALSLSIPISSTAAQCAKCITTSQCQFGPLAGPSYADCKIIDGVCFNSSYDCGSGPVTLHEVKFSLDGMALLAAAPETTNAASTSIDRTIRHCSGLVVAVTV